MRCLPHKEFKTEKRMTVWNLRREGRQSDNITLSFRFKENNIIDRDLYNYDKVLEIPDVTALNGSFRCRVVNQFGSEFSTAAELTVFGKQSQS